MGPRRNRERQDYLIFAVHVCTTDIRTHCTSRVVFSSFLSSIVPYSRVVVFQRSFIIIKCLDNRSSDNWGFTILQLHVQVLQAQCTCILGHTIYAKLLSSYLETCSLKFNSKLPKESVTKSSASYNQIRGREPDEPQFLKWRHAQPARQKHCLLQQGMAYMYAVHLEKNTHIAR